MSATVLGQLQIGYQLIWNRQRQIGGVLMHAQPLAHASLDGAHLVDVVFQAWSERSAPCLLAVPPGALLDDLLLHARAGGPWIVVPEQSLEDERTAAALDQAARRGVTLVSRGEPPGAGDHPRPSGLARGIRRITAAQALAALHNARVPAGGAAPETPPLAADQIYEGVGDLELAALALDRYQVWGLAGWPEEDIAQRQRGRPIPPQAEAAQRLLQALEADASIERIESLMLREPLLTWRFLRFANEGAARRVPVETIRHGVMLRGLGQVERWLRDQLPECVAPVDLRPLRDGLIVRAHLIAQLLDAGDEDELRHELLLCGMLSRIDLFCGEPLAQALRQVQLPERVQLAVLAQEGPYAPYLRLAGALEASTPQSATPCAQYGLDLADVNRALLRVLARARELTA